MANELDVIPSESDLAGLSKIAHIALNSKFLPDSIKTVEQAIIILLKGRELGIPPISSFSSIAVINGKPTLSAELMLALIYKKCPSAQIIFVKTSAAECVINARRNSVDAFSTFSFTIEDAKAAKLMSKTPWQNYPAAMLRARCISAVARAVFPDAILGSYTAEELGGDPSSDDIIDIPARRDDGYAAACEDMTRTLESLLLHVKDPDICDKVERYYDSHRNDLDALRRMVERVEKIIEEQNNKETDK
jgi:hypothetical protein